jgi:putative hydrolase of the HAD superfamily
MTGNADICKAVRAVFFDFGGVLATEGFREVLREIASRQGLDPLEVHLAGMDAIYDSGYIVGKGSEAEFWDLMRTRTGLTGTDEALTGELIGRFIIRPRMLEAAMRLRRMGTITAILSDQTDWLERLDARDHFFREFDHVFNSYRLGKGKRDPSLFADVVAGVGIAPHEALFVDDMPANVERAMIEGLQGIVFTDEDLFLAELDRLIGLHMY